ncbi:hypothetical protein GGG16DRAFT_91243 [Schizophyllum commune]
MQALAALFTVVFASAGIALGAPQLPRATGTTSAAAATGSQIRAVQDPVFHFYLQSNAGTPMLGPESSSGYFTLGSTIALNSDDSSAAPLYLNVNSSLNFLACATADAAFYDVFVQNGNETPGGSCTMITLHLPCLC